LVLSEFAGAAKELSETIIVNPNSIDEIADGIAEALSIPEEEQIRRNKIMQKRLKRYNVTRWASDFIETLIESSNVSWHASRSKLLTPELQDQMVEHFQNASNRLILINYDGNNSPVEEELKNGLDLLKLMKNLHRRANTDIVIISGKGKDDLDAWLEDAPVNVSAEHGAWFKEAYSEEWRLFKPLDNDWKNAIIPIFETYTDRLPGSFILERDYSLSWYYHKADIEQASFLVREVSDHLMSITTNIGLQVLNGDKVIEISNSGVNKGELAMHWLSGKQYDFILAIGAGWSDELLFQSIPEHSWTLSIGMFKTTADHVLKDQRDAIKLLRCFYKYGKVDQPAG
jgi:trehalose 6-phosphate synthase/phosphatase